ncbi:unnamed protein product [Nezara viridula]|uniref:Uncharacterized protein n=1 Tax=Nezara viridula TaxID=85310 RepID=A0A9P0HHZ6_NEZVI|nr:unnamed protein product [Nezara viridula]
MINGQIGLHDTPGSRTLENLTKKLQYRRQGTSLQSS